MISLVSKQLAMHLSQHQFRISAETTAPVATSHVPLMWPFPPTENNYLTEPYIDYVMSPYMVWARPD